MTESFFPALFQKGYSVSTDATESHEAEIKGLARFIITGAGRTPDGYIFPEKPTQHIWNKYATVPTFFYPGPDGKSIRYVYGYILN